MTQISARYETMGPICTTRRRRDDDVGGSPYRSRGTSSDYAFALLLGMMLNRHEVVVHLGSSTIVVGSMDDLFDSLVSRS